MSELVRGIITVGIALAIAAAIILLVEDAPSEPVKLSCISEDLREDIRGMTLSGIEQGFIKHMGSLFDIWVKDPADQPKRAKVGTENAVNAYIRARTDTEKWNPSTC